MVSVEINVHDNASIVVIVLKIWWCPLWLLRLLLRLHDVENLVKKSGGNLIHTGSPYLVQFQLVRSLVQYCLQNMLNSTNFSV